MMSLKQLLKAPFKIFNKEVITFLKIRRFDLGMVYQEAFRYISVKPSASIFVLRQKVWHLLELPDYCEEIIILKSAEGVELPLTELKKGNDPQHPYIMEVWLPGKQESRTTLPKNMITMGIESVENNFSLQTVIEKPLDNQCIGAKLSGETIELKKGSVPFHTIYTDFKKSELSCRISSSSIFKMNGKRSKDNLTSLLLKIQSDLTNLSNKLSLLENKIPT